MSSLSWSFGAFGVIVGSMMIIVIFTFIVYDIVKHEADLQSKKTKHDEHDLTPWTIRILLYTVSFMFPLHMLSVIVSMIVTDDDECGMSTSLSFFLLHLSESELFSEF